MTAGAGPFCGGAGAGGAWWLCWAALASCGRTSCGWCGFPVGRVRVSRREGLVARILAAHFPDVRTLLLDGRVFLRNRSTWRRRRADFGRPGRLFCGHLFGGLIRDFGLGEVDVLEAVIGRIGARQTHPGVWAVKGLDVRGMGDRGHICKTQWDIKPHTQNPEGSRV